MVNANKIESRLRHPVGKFFRPFAGEKLRGIHQICSVKTYRHAGTVTKFEVAVPGNNRAVFPRRSLQAGAEVEYPAGDSVFFQPDRFPLRSLLDENGTARCCFRYDFRCDGCCNDHPN